jgi:phosphatidyl-myo-inositol dimannoside synthase
MTDTPQDLGPQHRQHPQLKLTALAGRRSAFVAEVGRLALTTRIDLALIGHVNYAPLGLMLKGLQPGLRYGVMVHGVDVWSRLPWLKRQALQKADFITSVSEYTKHKVVETNGVDRGRVHILPNALEWKAEEDSEFRAPRFDLKGGGIKLLSVCRLEQSERYKGVDNVIEALPSVVEKIPDLQYYVIGGGTDLKRHERLARQVGIAEHVQFLGSVDEPTLRGYYDACDLFVMPSAGEGFGIVFLEAMKYSKAVIAAKSGAVSEVVRDGITGILVEYGNRKQLADSILALASNPNMREDMGHAGHRRLTEKFTYQHFRERFEEILLQEISTVALYRSRRECLTAAL